MAFGPEAIRLRRCTATRGDGAPCRAWAVWGDASQRCTAHGGRAPAGTGGRRERSRHIPCNCAAYQWPHRPGAGLCRWPLPPEQQHPTPGGTGPSQRTSRQSLASRTRGIARRMRKAGRQPAPIPPLVPFVVAWEQAQDDPEPEVYGEAEVVARARRRMQRGHVSEAGASRAWVAVPRAERDAMLARLEAGHWGGLRRVPGTDDEWSLLYGRWRIRGTWDRVRQRIVVLAVIGVC